jgi:5-methyltetrahydropteroyltriglutamate--homocysteine methyltransferase
MVRASSFCPKSGNASMSNAFRTTVVGSMPKRPWLYEKTFALDGKQDHFGSGGNWTVAGPVLKAAHDDATRAVIQQQEHAGVDIISDGEQRRKNYVTAVTAGMKGFDYETLGEKVMRGGRRHAMTGRCVGPIEHQRPIIADDLKFLLAHTNHRVKVTLPGAMTVVDSSFDAYYDDEEAFGLAWADAVNKEAKLLEALGADIIQFDEPAFSRYPDRCEKWGIEALNRSVAGLKTKTAVHICYGYPQPGLDRPILDSYSRVIAALETSNIDILALEFEGSKLSVDELKACKSKTVMFGSVFNSDDVPMETPEHVANRLCAAAEILSPDRVMAAPDCGLVMCSPDVAVQKLQVMCAGAQLARVRAGAA